MYFDDDEIMNTKIGVRDYVNRIKQKNQNVTVPKPFKFMKK